jgi:hypothetical protein
MELMDINEDGATDIRIFIFSNTPNQCDNYLFDKQNGTFRLIENCHLDVRKITGTHLYYSYNAIGCADMNWESYLSTIEGFELTHKGLISGEGCDDVKRIKIYRFAGGEQRQVAELPYTKYIPENDDKWSFIERYWAENHPRFE